MRSMADIVDLDVTFCPERPTVASGHPSNMVDKGPVYFTTTVECPSADAGSAKERTDVEVDNARKL